MCSCHSILECCVTFSGVKLSIRSFVLFLISTFVRNDFKLKENMLLLTDFFFKWTKYLNIMFKSQKTSGLAFVPWQHK